MAKGIQINLKGFEKMLGNLQSAGKSVDSAAAGAIDESARIVNEQLKAEAAASGVPDDITREILSETKHSDGKHSATVGWRLGTYNPRNPSAGYKAIFLNYGTVRRHTRRGANRGAIRKRSQPEQFIYRAKKSARPKVQRIQRDIMRKALGDIK